MILQLCKRQFGALTQEVAKRGGYIREHGFNYSLIINPEFDIRDSVWVKNKIFSVFFFSLLTKLNRQDKRLYCSPNPTVYSGSDPKDVDGCGDWLIRFIIRIICFEPASQCMKFSKTVNNVHDKMFYIYIYIT